MVYSYTRKLCKNENKLKPHATIWTNVTDVMLSQRSQSKRGHAVKSDLGLHLLGVLMIGRMNKRWLWGSVLNLHPGADYMGVFILWKFIWLYGNLCCTVISVRRLYSKSMFKLLLLIWIILVLFVFSLCKNNKDIKIISSYVSYVSTYLNYMTVKNNLRRH